MICFCPASFSSSVSAVVAARRAVLTAFGDGVAGVLGGELEAGLAGDEVAGDRRCEADAIVEGW